jgi:hypothetical protein
MYVDILFQFPLPDTCIVEWDVVQGNWLLQINSDHVLPHTRLNVPRKTFDKSDEHGWYSAYYFKFAFSINLIWDKNVLRNLDIVSPGSNAEEIHSILQRMFDDTINIRYFVS